MPEAFAWPEGVLTIYTGNATPSTSAVIAYARDTRASIAMGWDNRAAASGIYYNHLTGQRADISFNAIHTIDSTITKIFQSATAVHMKFMNTNAIGSAGYFLYSGRIASMQYVGSERSPFAYQLSYFANAWSAF